MRKVVSFVFFVFITCSFLMSGCTGNEKNEGKTAKYVFLFIGDGMGLPQVTLTETWLAAQKGEHGRELLSFSEFPVMGLASTYSANANITCSAAAGTALSTGFKTKNYMLGMDPDTNRLTSITYKIHSKNIPVGIISTVTIDHATPAAFYANCPNRGDYYNIAKQLPVTGFEFIGGGSFVYPSGKEKDQPDIFTMMEESGYTVIYGLDNLSKEKTSGKLALFQSKGKPGELPYAIDRDSSDLTLKDVVKAAIDHLDGENGFFIMAEGGKIDWAAHSNDAKTVIYEIIDFAAAVETAYEFYLKHPDETLIIVTSDHDTGGLGLGRTNGGNSLKLNELDTQNISFAGDSTKAAIIDGYNVKSNLGWTTTGHTASDVIVYSVGAGSSNFAGKMNNTDIPRKILDAMKIEF
jgi:alkaline phosphatase